MVREAIIMLEVEGYVEVRKGSVFMWSLNHSHQQAADTIWNRQLRSVERSARQLIESNTSSRQLRFRKTGHELIHQEQARGEQCFRDLRICSSYSGSLATQNSAPAAVVEKCGPAQP